MGTSISTSKPNLRYTTLLISTDSWRVIDTSFDMSNEVFQETPFPRVIKNSVGGKIAIINDSVSLIERNFEWAGSWYDIWVMNDTGVKRAWTKKFKLGPHPRFHKMLEFREDGLVPFECSDGWLILYVHKTQEVRNVAKYEHADFYVSVAASYTETLVLLNDRNVME